MKVVSTQYSVHLPFGRIRGRCYSIMRMKCFVSANRLPYFLTTAAVVCFITISIRAETGFAVLPASSTLIGPHASQQLLVENLAKKHFTGDATPKAKFTTRNAAIATVDEQGIVHPVADGDVTISATVSGQTATAMVTVTGTKREVPRSFRNEVEPVFAKMGCSMGACHGALAGKGGFKLSLRGYDAAADFRTITRGARGRRIEPTDPGSSLILLKPTMNVPHKGGLRFTEDSPAYDILSQWIAAGAPSPRDDDPRIEELEVFPAEVTLRAGDQQRVVVRARYSDGSARDVTQWVKFAATNEAVATVSDDGVIKVLGHGGGAVTAWYSSKIVNVRITSPYDAPVPDSVFAKAPRKNFIDELILKQLQLLRLPPSPPADDATFVRRVYLDTIGKLPTADEVRTFLADPSAEKRTRLIDSLLARPEFVDYWAYQWSDVLLVNGTMLRPEAVKAFYSWIRRQVEQNTPWDQFAREVVTARGSSLENGATNFYALHQDAESMTENISQAFLGLSIGCAKCHNHPLEKWTNDQYYAMANLFARVHAKGWGSEVKMGDGGRTLFVSDRGDLVQPSKGVPQPPAPLDAKPLPVDQTGDRRDYLADWLTSPNNPYFARAITNRIWANFFGVGLIESVDDLRLSNPASNEELLAASAKFLVDHHYNLKALMREILQSAAYQRSSIAVGGSRDDTRNYSHYYPRRLMAEVSLDAISQVTAVPSEFSQIEYPGSDFEKTSFYTKGTRALQLYDSAVVSRFLRTFGRNQRVITCQCERSNEPSLVQALHISNGDTILKKLEAKDGKIESLLTSKLPNYRIVEDLYLSALSRYPTDREMTSLLSTMNGATAKDRRAVLEDVYWAVLSSREFLFNH
jgi:hypothetical protein